MNWKTNGILPVLILAAAAAIPATATAVSGQANIEGTASVWSGAVYFGPNQGNTDTNNFVVGPPSGDPNNPSQSGDFAGLTGGFLRNLVGPGGKTGGAVTGAVNLADFAEFNVPGGVITFDLTFIPKGFGTGSCMDDTAGNQCTPANSPFTLIEVPGHQTIIALSLDGTAYLGSKASGFSNGATSIFTTQTVDGDISTIYDAIYGIGQPQTSVVKSFSATFSAVPAAAVPEPASMLLMGVGLLGAGVIARKRYKRS